MKIANKFTKKLGRYGDFERARQAAERLIARLDTVAPQIRSLLDDEAGQPGNKTFDQIRRGSTGPVTLSAAGYTAGQRDQLAPGHWALLRMERYGVSPFALAGGMSKNGVRLPRMDQIRQAVVARWGHLVGPDGDRLRLYAGESRSDRIYDATHSTDGLLRTTFDVTLRELVNLFQALHDICRALFEAAWVRDYATVDRLALINANALPVVGTFVQIDDKRERVLTTLSLFYEWERLFDFIESGGGPNRITELSLGAALSSPTSLASAAVASDRRAGYISGSWMHILPLVDFATTGAAGHSPHMPLVALGPDGTPGLLDPGAGMSTPSAMAMLRRAHAGLKPFANKAGISPVDAVYPAHFLNGATITEIAFAAPAMLYASLPSRAGYRASSAGEVPLYSALGRLGIIVLANVCADSAAAALKLAEANSKEHVAGPSTALRAADLVSNLDEWAKLMEDANFEKAVAKDAKGLEARLAVVVAANEPRRERMFETSVRDASAKSRIRLTVIESVMPDIDLAFDARAWAKAAAPVGRSFAWPVQSLDMTMPGRASTDSVVVEFCRKIAYELRTGVTSSVEDPILRELCLVGPPASSGASASSLSAVRSLVGSVVADARVGSSPELRMSSPREINKRRARSARKGRHQVR